MIHSVVMLGFFVMGVTAGNLDLLPVSLTRSEAATGAFYVLLGLVGIGVGSNEKCMAVLRSVGVRIVLIPVGIVVGSLLGAALASLLIDMSLREALAVGGGLGYYSLSSILITQISGRTLAVIALLSNLFREIITLAAAPILSRRIGKYSPIAAGGATALDTSLAVVTKFSGSEYAMIAVFSGAVLTFLVPLLVSFILKIGA
jgi:uncharacterized membrane protein YbjE (DUF340 family)